MTEYKVGDRVRLVEMEEWGKPWTGAICTIVAGPVALIENEPPLFEVLLNDETLEPGIIYADEIVSYA